MRSLLVQPWNQSVVWWEIVNVCGKQQIKTEKKKKYIYICAVCTIELLA